MCVADDGGVVCVCVRACVCVHARALVFVLCACACACVSVAFSVRRVRTSCLRTLFVVVRLTCLSGVRRTVSAATPAVLLVVPGVQAETYRPSICAACCLTPLALPSYCGAMM